MQKTTYGPHLWALKEEKPNKQKTIKSRRKRDSDGPREIEKQQPEMNAKLLRK